MVYSLNTMSYILALFHFFRCGLFCILIFQWTFAFDLSKVTICEIIDFEDLIITKKPKTQECFLKQYSNALILIRWTHSQSSFKFGNEDFHVFLHHYHLLLPILYKDFYFIHSFDHMFRNGEIKSSFIVFHYKSWCCSFHPDCYDMLYNSCH